MIFVFAILVPTEIAQRRAASYTQETAAGESAEL